MISIEARPNTKNSGIMRFLPGPWVMENGHGRSPGRPTSFIFYTLILSMNRSAKLWSTTLEYSLLQCNGWYAFLDSDEFYFNMWLVNRRQLQAIRIRFFTCREIVLFLIHVGDYYLKFYLIILSLCFRIIPFIIASTKL